MTSNTAVRYHHRTESFAGDEMLAAISLAAATQHEEYIVYEDQQQWVYARGVLAEIYADPDGIHLHGIREEHIPWDGRPLEHVQNLLDSLPVADWHAYGWAAFELHHASTHGHAEDDRRYLHLVVPRTEVRIRPGEVRLRSVDPAELETTAAALSGGAIPARGVAEPIAVREHGAEDYKILAKQAIDIVGSTDIRKIILSRKVPLERGVDFVNTYLAGRRGNQPARSFLLNLGGVEAAGFCPEIVVKVDTEGGATIRPLAGTRALTADPAENQRLRAELLNDPKEVYEHALSVKQACEGMATACTPESVAVDEFMVVRERGSVQHLGSTITGTLARGRSAWDAFEVAFPSVTASGIPKAAACAAIRQLETQQRGIYSGAVLSIDHSGAFDSALVLRGVYRENGTTWLQAGAGIIEQSTPEREFEETCEKLDSVARFVVPS